MNPSSGVWRLGPLLTGKAYLITPWFINQSNFLPNFYWEVKIIKSKLGTYWGLQYTIFEDGTIVGPKRGILKQRENKDGYMEVTMGTLDQRHACVRVHRLVAEQFIPNPKKLPEVNHIDYNRKNNHVSNLEWCTHKDNVKHSSSAGRYRCHNGEKNGRAKLTKETVKLIRKDYESGKTIADIGRKYSVPWSTVNNIVKGITWNLAD